MSLREIGIICVFIAFVISGCVMGEKATSAVEARGLTGRLSLFESQLLEGYDEKPVRIFKIELLALQEDGLLFLAKNKVIFAPYERIKYLNLEHVPAKRIEKGSNAAEVKALLTTGAGYKLQPLSRFPQGVSSELLSRLLAAYDQNEILAIQ